MLTNKVDLLHIVHDHHIVHRHIKPENVVLGLPGTKSANLLHLTDFRSADLYRKAKTLQHIPQRSDRTSRIYTLRFSSLDSDLNKTQSRRSDLQSLGYVLIYFLRGDMPWPADSSKRRIKEIKQTTTPAELCKGFPGIIFAQYRVDSAFDIYHRSILPLHVICL